MTRFDQIVARLEAAAEADAVFEAELVWWQRRQRRRARARWFVPWPVPSPELAGN